MNWPEVQTQWDEYGVVVKSYFDQLTDEDVDVIGRNRDKLIELIQLRYRFTRDRAVDAICRFEKDVRRPGAVK